MGKINIELMPKPKKIYDEGIFSIFLFNDRRYVIATSLEEAVSIFRDYQEKDENPYKGDTIKTIELISKDSLSKKKDVVEEV